MVRPIERDSRGVIAPWEGLRRFRLDRAAPSPALAPWVDRYWTASWSLPAGEEHVQEVLVHPAVNIVAEASGVSVVGVQRATWRQRLRGTGSASAVMFRPAGFRRFLAAPLASLTDRVIPLEEALPRAGLPEHPDSADLDAWLLALLEAGPAGVDARETTELVERAAADPALLRVEQLAALAGVAPRTLERRFRDHVGASPKWVLRRYRIYEIAERVAHEERIAWADLAAALGYADQSHLIRDFTAVVGESPARYAARRAADPA